MTDSASRPAEEPAPLCECGHEKHRHGAAGCATCFNLSTRRHCLGYRPAAAPVPPCPSVTNAPPELFQQIDDALERANHVVALNRGESPAVFPIALIHEMRSALAACRIWLMSDPERSAFAADVERLREECARICEQRAESLADDRRWTAANEAHKCAMAIRMFASPNGVEIAARSTEQEGTT